MSATSITLRGRIAAEALMVDTCTIKRLTGSSTDQDTGVVTPTYSTTYTGKCRLKLPTAVARPITVGEAQEFTQHPILSLPATTTGIEVDDIVTITASLLDAVAGREGVPRAGEAGAVAHDRRPVRDHGNHGLMGAKAHGLTELEADLRKAAEEAVPAAKKIAGKGSLNIKKNAQRIIRGASHRGYLPHYPRSITYEVKASGTLVSSEIGPESTKLQGGLGRLIENGSVNNAPIPHLSPALDAEENAFYSYMEDLGEQLLEGKTVQGGPVTDPG
jgi:hypothetical protein